MGISCQQRGRFAISLSVLNQENSSRDRFKIEVDSKTQVVRTRLPRTFYSNERRERRSNKRLQEGAALQLLLKLLIGHSQQSVGMF